MTTLYDENGNAVEGALAPDEVKQLQEKATQVETLETELKKFQDKDFNFSKFREKSKEEQEKLRESMTAKEKLLLDEITDLRTQIGAKDEATLGQAKKQYIDRICGEDKEYRERLEAEFNRLPGNVLTPDQVQQKLDEANVLVRHRMESQNQPTLMGFAPSFTSPYQVGAPKRKSYADTPEGKGLAGELGLSTDTK